VPLPKLSSTLKCGIQKFGQLTLVHIGIAGGWAGAGLAADVAEGGGRREQGAEAGLDKGPGAHVLGLFLDPGGVRLRGVGGGEGIEEFRGEGVELFESDDCSVGGFAFGAGGLEVVVDLAAAEDEALYAGLRRFGVG